MEAAAANRRSQHQGNAESAGGCTQSAGTAADPADRLGGGIRQNHRGAGDGNPRSGGDAAASGEYLCRDKSRRRAARVCLSQRIRAAWLCARAFNHFGPGQREMFVVSDFCKQTAEIELGLREPVIRTGNLDARRDFTDVRDIVRAYAMLLESGRAGEIYNVGSGKTAAISEILDLILAGSETAIRHEIDPAKLRPAETAHIAADPEKLHRDTGWLPEIATAQTVADTLAFWRQKLKEQSEA